MATDMHLDTSWCPVCDCAILPKRYSVPVTPPQLTTAGSSTAVKASQTTRGKNGTIKVRNGLVQGTGRMRPALNRANSTKGKATSQRVAEQEQLVEETNPQRMRIIIDQSPTPLYCSEECRKRDLEDSWPVAPPPARKVLDTLRRPSRTRLGEHPSQINPALASPPPPSPTMPPVPPNSWRAPLSLKQRSLELNVDELAACIQEADEHSDSSSATGTSFTVSDRSPVSERGMYGPFNDPPPPPLAPLPPHPHRPSAPVVKPGANRRNQEPLYEGGIMMAAKRIQAYLASGAIDDEQTKKEKREREEKQRKEEERWKKLDFSGEYARSSSIEREKKKQEEMKVPAIDPSRWTELVYNYRSNSSGSTPPPSPGIPSTHRRSSDTDKSKRIRAPDAPNRTQSALELYEKYPLFARSSSSSNTAAGKGKGNKSSASIATSYAPVYGITTSGSSSSVKSSRSVASEGVEGASALTLPGVDPELYAGKRLGGPRQVISADVRGKVLLPDVLLRPPLKISSSLPCGSGLAPPPSSGMKRSGSEASVTGRKTSGRSASTLGAVREGEAEGDGGVWHRPEEGSEDSRSSVTRSSESRSRRGKGKKSRSSKRVEKSPIAEEPAPIDNSKGPLYDVPQVPVTQLRYEEVFVPDPIPPSIEEIPIHLETSFMHKKDVVLSRREIREVARRRGEFGEFEGWWVEKEWEVRAYPERKKLFTFGGDKP